MLTILFRSIKENTLSLTHFLARVMKGQQQQKDEKRRREVCIMIINYKRLSGYPATRTVDLNVAEYIQTFEDCSTSPYQLYTSL